METKTVMVGNVPVGGGKAVSIQSMLNMRFDDIEGNISQAKKTGRSGLSDCAGGGPK
jgi:4-hydroxy-3-methylbut-2-en-1-yl diphosphate synthase IspG/GcpE